MKNHQDCLLRGLTEPCNVQVSSGDERQGCREYSDRQCFMPPLCVDVYRCVYMECACVYIYEYLCRCVYMYMDIYVYVYIYIEREREREREREIYIYRTNR